MAITNTRISTLLAATMLATAPTLAAAGVIGVGGVSPAVGPGDTNIVGQLQIGTVSQVQNGSVTVSANSVLTTSDYLSMGGGGFTGTLEINTGGEVQIGTFASLGTSAGTGSINVDGSTSSLSLTGAMFAGGNGPGSFGLVSATSGATISSSALVLGQDAGTSGTATINGTGSQYTTSVVPNAESLAVGRAGVGVLNIENSGVFTSTGITNIGFDVGGNGTLNVAGGTFEAQGRLVAGEFGNGNVVLTQGATLNAQGTVSFGNSSSGHGTAIVSDGAVFNIQGSHVFGAFGDADIHVGDNPNTVGTESTGTINGIRAVIGSQPSSVATVNVNGSGASYNLVGLDGSGSGAFLNLGAAGTGTVNLSNGGTVLIDSLTEPTGGSNGGLQIGSNTGSNIGTGEINIDGAGSSFTVARGFSQVGRSGNGTVNVTNGGIFDTSGATTDVVGRRGAAVGLVNVTGQGSTWAAGNNVFIGVDVDLASSTVSGVGGQGTVNVANGGALTTGGTVYIGANGTLTGGGGTITGNIENHGILAPGNSPGHMNVVGNVMLAADGITQIELGGIVFDSGTSTYEYDRVTVDGDVTVADGATFDVSLFGGFVAAAGNFFDVLVADAFSFVDMDSWNVLLPTLDSGLIWSYSIFAFSETQSSLRLLVAQDGPSAVPAPPALLLMLAGLAVLTAMRRRPAA